MIVPATDREAGAAMCSGIGGVVFLIGIAMVIAYYSYYRVMPGYALVDGNGRVEPEGRYFGIPPSSPKVISTVRRVVEIPGMELETPDDGVLGASITVSYSPDLGNPTALKQFENPQALDMAIKNRIKGALNSWSMGKPSPGTLKRAVAAQRDAETFLLSQLSGASQYLVPLDDPSLYLGDGLPASHFGIRIHEVNIISWRPLTDGTGKPDWGDGDHVRFDADAIFKQFHAHTDSLSSLRKLKDALREKYPDEVEDIDDIYDQVRISMKENRDR